MNVAGNPSEVTMTVTTLISAVLQRGLEMLRRRDAEVEALRLFFGQRRAGTFVDLEVGERETHAMLIRKRKLRAAL